MFSHLAIFREILFKFIKIATHFTSLRVSRNTTINDMLNLHMTNNKINHLKSRTNARKSCWRLSYPVFKPIRAKNLVQC